MGLLLIFSSRQFSEAISSLFRSYFLTVCGLRPCTVEKRLSTSVASSGSCVGKIVAFLSSASSARISNETRLIFRAAAILDKSLRVNSLD